MSEELGKHVRDGAPATEKFDLARPMIKQKAYALLGLWTFSSIRKWIHLGTVKKVRMKGVKPPYILICNHNAFFDFYVMSSAIAPYRGIFPAAVDDFIGRERELRKLGGIPKRKFTTDIGLLRQCKSALDEKQIFGIYAEAKYSLCGVTEDIPESVGQLIKFHGVPAVVLTCRGHHIYDPFWGDHRKRWVKPIEATMTQAFTPEEIKEATADEINEKIKELLYNDDFRWQSEHRVKVSYSKRAEGLHRVLYQCPHCMTEYQMDSKNDMIYCKHCHKSWKLNYYGELEAIDGKTEFKFATDWYKWERELVKKEVLDGTYYFESDCHVNDLPNSKGFVRMGNGHVIHDMNGFRLKGIRDYDGEPFEMNIKAAAQYDVQIEYNYRFGNFKDCIGLNTLNDTWYVFPDNCEFSLTKISIATEEIFKEIWRKRKIERETARQKKLASQ